MDERKREREHRRYDAWERGLRSAAGKKRVFDAPEVRRSKASAAAARARSKNYEAATIDLTAGAVAQSGDERIDALVSDSGMALKRKARFFPMDAPFFMLVIGLLCVGMVMMYSAGYAWSIYFYGTPTQYLKVQVEAAVIGLGAMIFLAFYDYNRMKKWVVPFFIVTVFLLVLVLLIGKVANGAKRWLNIGGIGFQPSEFAKFAVILTLSWTTSLAGSRIRQFKWSVLPYIIVLVIILPLIFLQKHISAVVLITLTASVIVFVAGVNWRYIIGALTVGGVGIYGLTRLDFFAEKFSYVSTRIAIWKDPFSDTLGAGYQTIQSLYAIASGGLFGLGLGQSRQKQLYLPEAHNDYVFSIVCEELGLVGAIIIILLFAALIIRGYWIAMHAADRFGSMLATGITTLIALQILMNIAVVTNAMPVTGISLPFFSYGGTSLVILLAEMGVVLSVSKQMRIKGK